MPGLDQPALWGRIINQNPDPHTTFRRFFTYGLLGINAVVWAGWNESLYVYQNTKDLSLLGFMMRNFVVSDRNLMGGRWWTWATHAISHIQFSHLAANMGGLVQFAPLALQFGVRPIELSLISLGSAVWGALAQLWYQKKTTPSLAYRSGTVAGGVGASGMIMGIIMAVTLMRPEYFVSFRLWGKFEAQLPLCVMAAGWLFIDYQSLGDKKIGHAAHLGGAAFGGLMYLLLLTDRRPGGGVSRGSGGNFFFADNFGGRGRRLG